MPTKSVELLHGIFERGLEECYERKLRNKKSINPPWVNSKLIGMIKVMRAIYRDHKHRSEAWNKMKKKADSYAKKRKESYNKERREKMKNCSSRGFHACVRSFTSDENVKKWNPRSLFPELTEKDCAEKYANFFNSISSEYHPIDRSMITDLFDCPITAVTAKEIEEKIKKGKRSKSRVKGDIFVNVLRDNIETISPAVAHIFNLVIKTGLWPVALSTEYVTVIPKGKSPETAAETRNISCTNFLSKPLERFVLRWASEQATPNNNQYGGRKGCSTNHMLVDLYDKISDDLEDNRTACILTAIDYSKAYNRLEHLAVLEALKTHGASYQIS